MLHLPSINSSPNTHLLFLLNNLANNNEEFLNTTTKALLVQKLLELPNRESWKTFIIISLSSSLETDVLQQLNMFNLTSSISESLATISPGLPINELLTKLRNVFKSFENDSSCLTYLLNNQSNENEDGWGNNTGWGGEGNGGFEFNTNPSSIDNNLLMYLLCNNNNSQSTPYGETTNSNTLNNVLPYLLTNSVKNKNNNYFNKGFDIKRPRFRNVNYLKNQTILHEKEIRQLIDSADLRSELKLLNLENGSINPFLIEVENSPYNELDEMNEKLSEIHFINELLSDKGFLGYKLFV
jgi:hypothetical protein